MSGGDVAVLVGLLIKRTRQVREWTQLELADKLGVAQATVSLWESGKRCPSVDDLLEVAAVLRVDPQTLLPDDPRPLPPITDAAPAPGTPWLGHGPEADALHWQLAAEWLWCQVRHGNALGDIMPTSATKEQILIAMAALEQGCELLMTGTQRLRHGHTEEACCAEKQRQRRGLPLWLSDGR